MREGFPAVLPQRDAAGGLRVENRGVREVRGAREGGAAGSEMGRYGLLLGMLLMSVALPGCATHWDLANYADPYDRRINPQVACASRS